MSMDVGKVKRSESASFSAAAPAGASGGSGGGNFQGHLGSSLKDSYRRQVDELFDELSGLSDTLLKSMDITTFEKYRGMIRELLGGIIRNAYHLSTEQTMDRHGRQRAFESVTVIDNKLDELARDVLDQNKEKLDFLSRVDEIRGLIMDLLL
jgi:uncharacterized protein YaaR (DUF327 family)